MPTAVPALTELAARLNSTLHDSVCDVDVNDVIAARALIRELAHDPDTPQVPQVRDPQPGLTAETEPVLEIFWHDARVAYLLLDLSDGPEWRLILDPMLAELTGAIDVPVTLWIAGRDVELPLHELRAAVSDETILQVTRTAAERVLAALRAV